jgi:hypothetical protein
MAIEAKYAHTNIVARDWRVLASFYERVLGCVPVPPERHYTGPALEAGTGAPGAKLDGVHLRLPGLGDAGPRSGRRRRKSCARAAPPWARS